MSEVKPDETHRIYNIRTSGVNVVQTPERFMDQVILGTFTFNALAKLGYRRPEGPSGEWTGIDKDRLREDLESGVALRGIGSKSMKRIQELLAPSVEK